MNLNDMSNLYDQFSIYLKTVKNLSSNIIKYYRGDLTKYQSEWLDQYGQNCRDISLNVLIKYFDYMAIELDYSQSTINKRQAFLNFHGLWYPWGMAPTGTMPLFSMQQTTMKFYLLSIFTIRLIINPNEQIFNPDYSLE